MNIIIYVGFLSYSLTLIVIALAYYICIFVLYVACQVNNTPFSL